MSNLSDLFYSFMLGAVLLLSLMGLWYTYLMPGLNRRSTRFFRCYFVVLMLCCLSAIMETSLSFYVFPNAVVYFVLVMESLFLSLPLPMLTVYLLHCCGGDPRRDRFFKVILGLWTVFFVLLVSDPFLEVSTVLLPDGQYIRGPWYPFQILPLTAIMLLNLAYTIRHRNRLSHKTFLSFLIAILPMTVTLVIQLFVDVFPLLDISIVLSGLSMYSLILSDQIEQDLRRQHEIAQQQLEIANQRANVMVLQMRPHFIYNTMTSIYCLCKQDPEKARQVVLNFTTYLRKNFTAVASDTTVPFSSELEHTRAYLAVEQAQYEDSLFIDYDLPHVWFRVPPLTLQPIVENAVKHGRDPSIGPFHISIRTRKTKNGSEIVVADNGRGFEPAEDSRPHIALNNIRQRLAIMCGGSLTITPGGEGGTVITITVPDRKE